MRKWVSEPLDPCATVRLAEAGSGAPDYSAGGLVLPVNLFVFNALSSFAQNEEAGSPEFVSQKALAGVSSWLRFFACPECSPSEATQLVRFAKSGGSLGRHFGISVKTIGENVVSL